MAGNTLPMMDFDKLRTDMIAVTKSAGRQAACTLLRHVDAAPADPSLPWRVGAGTIKQFPFTGVVSDVPFSRLGEPAFDGAKNIIIPGDITTTAATGDPGTLCGNPTHLDRIDVGGTQYQIAGIQEINPFNNPIVFIVRAQVWPSISSVPPMPS